MHCTTFNLGQKLVSKLVDQFHFLLLLFNVSKPLSMSLA